MTAFKYSAKVFLKFCKSNWFHRRGQDFVIMHVNRRHRPSAAGMSYDFSLVFLVWRTKMGNMWSQLPFARSDLMWSRFFRHSWESACRTFGRSSFSGDRYGGLKSQWTSREISRENMESGRPLLSIDIQETPHTDKTVKSEIDTENLVDTKAFKASSIVYTKYDACLLTSFADSVCTHDVLLRR